MSTKTDKPRAAIYARLSHDVRMGSDREGENVEYQLKHARALAAERDFNVVAEYVENDVSAGGYRPDYERMRQSIEAGELDVVITHKHDRLLRRVSDLEALVDLAEQLPLGVMATHSTGLDLTSSQGKLVARLLTAVAEAELDVTRDRLRVAKERLRSEGRNVGTGRRPFGFEAELLDSKTKKGKQRFTLTGRLDEHEAAVIRESAQRFLAGDSLLSLTQFWFDNDMRTDDGRRVSPATVRRVLLNPRTAGMAARVVSAQQWEIVGRAQWPAILDVETQERIRLVAHDPTRKSRGGRESAAGSKQSWWLTGLLVCAECGNKLTPKYAYTTDASGERTTNPGDYACQKQTGGCNANAISKRKLDRLVRERFVEDVQSARLAAALEDEQSPLLSERTTLLARIDALSSRRAQLSDDMGRGRIDYDTGLLMLDSNAAELDAARAELAELVRDVSSTDALAVLDVDALDDLREDEMRSVARALYSRIVVSKAAQRGGSRNSKDERVRFDMQ
jgi:site-specific DNA recombinase